MEMMGTKVSEKESTVAVNDVHRNDSKHPCFNVEAKSKYGRVHLPVAPKCNVQCNFCNRKYDCVNESRPGVSSAILAPAQSVDYLKKITQKGVDIAVIGIAGPGDPMANFAEVSDTIQLAKKDFPEMVFCLSTNGLELYENIPKLKELGVTHVTITINAVEPKIVADIYAWMRFNKKVYRGIEAGKLLIERQLSAIIELKAQGFVVKINTIVLPGVNDHHLLEIAKTVSVLGADTMNCIPVHPTADTAFEDLREPTHKEMNVIREQISAYIKPMAHCARCRADAAGLLGHDIEGSYDLIKESAAKPLFVTENRPYVAIASHEGYLINQHLGEASNFIIYTSTPSGFKVVETRSAPLPGSGDMRWMQLARMLHDCNTVLVSGAGPNPVSMLKSMGIKVVIASGLIEEGLDAIFYGRSLSVITNAKPFKCGDSCGGTGTGCG